MYVCLCNGLTDRAIESASDVPDCSVSDVYKALGCAPRCGKCVPVVRQMLKRADDLSFADSAA
jgi:bacterioferritin-associated ferredoxin